MLVDMVHDNHGEPLFKTRFRQTSLLKSYGYDGIVIPDALGVVPGARREIPSTGPLHHAISQLRDAIDARVMAAAADDMRIFFYGDALLLPRAVVRRDPENFQCSDGSGRLCAGRPAVFAALAKLVLELFAEWPDAAGLIMRTGEVYPESLPHMTGNPLQQGNCPRCRGISPLQRTARFISTMRDAVVAGAGKKYIHRAWQSTEGSGLHNDPETYLELLRQIPADDVLFSFKFTRGEFHAGQPWNPCLVADNRPKWIELPSAREAEGKGAFPNFQAPLWTGLSNGTPGIHALKDIPPAVRAGLWGTSRGAGWGGPYLQREEWLDSNVYALGRLAADPFLPAEAIARDWAVSMFGLPEDSPATSPIVDILMRSADVVRALLYVPGGSPGRHAAPRPILRDDLVDMETLWSAAADAVAQDRADEACQEKKAAADAVSAMRRSFEGAAAAFPHKGHARDLTNTLISYESLAGTIAEAFIGFVRFSQWQKAHGGTALAELAEQHLHHAQAYWQHHTQRHAMLPGAPSVFNEGTFWERSNACLEGLAGIGAN